MTITYLRTRPADTVHELTAKTRRREGTTTLEFGELATEDRGACLAGGVLPVVDGVAEGDPAAWIVSPSEAQRLVKRGVPGWRITIVDDGGREAVLDALARTQAAYLRTRRS